jgi:hypothetical protein
VQFLNVAGPRASEDTQIYSDVVIILEQVVRILKDDESRSSVELEHPRQSKPSEPPRTVQEAVDRLIDELPLKDKTTIANMAENDLITLQFSLGTYIGREFGIWSGNRELLDSCEFVSGDIYLHPDFAPTVIIVELWNRLQQTHRLRVVK